MRWFAAGVTVITSYDAAGRPVGMTATAFTSVSLDPPMVLVCAKSDSRTAAAIAVHGSFAVNILAVEDRELAARFATRVDDKFDGVDWEGRPPGVPALGDALAVVCCRVSQTLEAGSHLVYIGEVVATASKNDGDPLVYLDGGYRTVAPLD